MFFFSLIHPLLLFVFGDTDSFAVPVVEWIWCDFELRVFVWRHIFASAVIRQYLSLSVTIMTRTHIAPRHRGTEHIAADAAAVVVAADAAAAAAAGENVRVPRASNAASPVFVHTKCNGSQTNGPRHGWPFYANRWNPSIGDAMASCGSVRAIRVNLIASFVRCRRYSTAKPVPVVDLMDGKNELAARFQR